MQTFYPIVSEDFLEQAKALDNLRLNKQALEGWQILMVLLELDPLGNDRTPKGWVNHPAVKMWRGYEFALLKYVEAMCEEWRNRGYKTTVDVKAKATYEKAVAKGKVASLDILTLPTWIKDKTKLEDVAKSHRTALLNKNYEYYSQHRWKEGRTGKPDSYEYVWLHA